MTGWIIVALAGTIGIGFVLSRIWRSSRGGASQDFGEVSQSWLTEERARKQQDH